MKVLGILERAASVIEMLPHRIISAETERGYRSAFGRMWREEAFDPLVPGAAVDTYFYRRAALHWVGRALLVQFRDECRSAADRNDLAAVQASAAKLMKLLDRIEPALQRDPPLKAGLAPLQSPTSRWRAASGEHQKRGANSKRDVLKLLPPDWDERVWLAALDEWNDPADLADLQSLAVSLLVPVRPQEFIAGERPYGWSDGVLVERRSPRLLAVTIWPAKSRSRQVQHPGLYRKDRSGGGGRPGRFSRRALPRRRRSHRRQYPFQECEPQEAGAARRACIARI